MNAVASIPTSTSSEIIEAIPAAGEEVPELVRIAGALDSNDGQVIRQAALAGMGILIQPLFIIADDVRAGRLTPILTQWTLPTLNMNIAWSNRSRLPAKIRVFVDFLVARIGANRASGINAA